MGTVDATSWLAIPEALELHRSLDLSGGLRRHNEQLALAGQRYLAGMLGVSRAELWHAAGTSVACVPLRDDVRPDLDAEGLYDLFAAAGAELAVSDWDGRRLIRVSGQAYLSPDAMCRVAVTVARALGAANP